MSLISDSINKFKSITKTNSEDKKPLEIDTWTGQVTRDTKIDECPFVVFDTELTGLNIRKDSIISIGAIKMTGKKIHAALKFYRLVNPLCNLESDNILIHRITPDDLETEDSIDAILPEFLSFIKDAVLVGHFVHIDTGFTNKFMKSLYGAKLKNPAIDTSNIHDWLMDNDSTFRRRYSGGCLKTDLFSMSKKYNIDVDEAHNSLADAYITAQLFQRFLTFLEPNGIKTFKDLLKIGKS